MTYEVFEKSLAIVKTWREKENKALWEWPDSRDPAVLPYFYDTGVAPYEMEKSIIALAAWRELSEARYQGLSSIVHLIANRQKKGWQRSHISQEHNTLEFRSMWDPESPLLTEYPTEEFDFKKLLDNLEDILNNKTLDITEGSLFYSQKIDTEQTVTLIAGRYFSK